MSLLRRYVVSGFLRSYVTALGALAGFYVLIDALSRIDEFARSADASLVVTYYLLLLPTVLYQVSPAACLIAVLAGIGKLARSNEILAMRGAGISPARIVAPVLLAGAIIAAGAAVWDEYVVTATAGRAKALYRERVRRKQAGDIVRGLILEHGGRSYYIGELDLAAGTMRQVNITRFGAGWQEEEIIDAAGGAWDGRAWKLRDGVIRRYSGPDLVEERRFDELAIDLGLGPDALALSAVQPESLRLKQLLDRIDYVRKQGAEPRKAIYEIHMRLAAPLANIVTILVGLTFALNLHRGGAMAGFGIAIGLSIVYYLLTVLFCTMQQGGVLLPEVAAWLPNALFGVGTAVGFALYQSRH